jgi:hypothetical protein
MHEAVQAAVKKSRGQHISREEAREAIPAAVTKGRGQYISSDEAHEGLHQL